MHTLRTRTGRTVAGLAVFLASALGASVAPAAAASAADPPAAAPAPAEIGRAHV